MLRRYHSRAMCVDTIYVHLVDVCISPAQLWPCSSTKISGVIETRIVVQGSWALFLTQSALVTLFISQNMEGLQIDAWGMVHKGIDNSIPPHTIFSSQSRSRENRDRWDDASTLPNNDLEHLWDASFSLPFWTLTVHAVHIVTYTEYPCWCPIRPELLHVDLSFVIFW